MQDKPIGIFDSGLGGLTALKEVAKIMPNENIMYLGDTLRAPYGDKDNKVIAKYARQGLSFLKKYDIKFALAACGTISSVVNFYDLGSEIPVVGVLPSTCTAAIQRTKNGKIGVIGTLATIKSNAYKNTIVSLLPDAYVYQQACPMFAPLIESGKVLSDRNLIFDYAKEYLLPLKNLDIDTLILGCTHYPIIKEIIRAVMEERVELVDSGQEAAKFIFNELRKKKLLSTRNSNGLYKFFVTGDRCKFLQTANVFLQRDISEGTGVVDIDKWS